MSLGLHHFYKNKRLAGKQELFPRKSKQWVNLIDDLVYVAGIVGPIMTLPQIIKIFGNKSAEGVSLITWLAYTLAAVFWLLYGIAHKEKPIIMTYALWVLFDLAVVYGCLVY